MDSKGKVAQVAYPNIVFCIDNFEDIFGDIFTSKRGQKVAVQLLATNDVSSKYSDVIPTCSCNITVFLQALAAVFKKQM